MAVLLSGALPAVADNYLVGDINLDGSVTVSDMVMLVKMINDKSTTDKDLNTDKDKALSLLAADVNEDNKIDEADVSGLLLMVVGKTDLVYRETPNPSTPVGGSTTDFD